MSERSDSIRLHEWLDETVGQTPDPVEGTRQVMSQAEGIPQVGRWLPFPVLRRSTGTRMPTTSDTLEFQSSPIPASNGHTPTVIGRTRSMLSPVKAITAGALVFAIGSAFLIAQPFSPQATAPGAETAAMAPVWVTGQIGAAPSCSSPDVEVDDGILHYTNMECSPQTWTATDPRLTGEVVRRYSEDVYRTEEGTFSISVDTPYLQNDGGGWACLDTSLVRGSQMSSELLTGTTFTCAGDGGYQGLSAILVSEVTVGNNEAFAGLIFSGDFPPLPEPPAAE